MFGQKDKETKAAETNRQQQQKERDKERQKTLPASLYGHE